MRKYLIPRYILKTLKVSDIGFKNVTEPALIRRISRLKLPSTATNLDILAEVFWKFNTRLDRVQFTARIVELIQEWETCKTLFDTNPNLIKSTLAAAGYRIIKRL